MYLVTQSGKTVTYVKPGQLVKIGGNAFSKKKITGYGIIIECVEYNLSWESIEEWVVLINGNLEIVQEKYIWPFGE